MLFSYSLGFEAGAERRGNKEQGPVAGPCLKIDQFR